MVSVVSVSTVTDAVNGTLTTRTYDSREMLASLETRTSSGGLLSGFSYLRDPEGNLQALTVSHAGDSTSIAYAHDGLSRLTSEDWTGATVYQGAYAYDPAGNRTLKTITSGGSTAGVIYGYDEENRLRTSREVVLSASNGKSPSRGHCGV